ncbi:hypothetical protein [Rhodococcus sp. B10]|uniref:hypothetical protein n=1 Tax=Rhodococcus sp. B10 TaxID=2695876 RepID=UPI0014305361|nr:hypothetical protein [Rhodococcus sp. B10]
MSIIEASFWVQVLILLTLVLILLTLWAFAFDAVRRRNPLTPMSRGGMRRTLTVVAGVLAIVVVAAVAATAYYS